VLYIFVGGGDSDDRELVYYTNVRTFFVQLLYRCAPVARNQSSTVSFSRYKSVRGTPSVYDVRIVKLISATNVFRKATKSTAKMISFGEYLKLCIMLFTCTVFARVCSSG
jgi:hypothetical protein